ncbi:hypothetical protein BJX96DRAFT_183728 [Aspergillus floccosus]
MDHVDILIVGAGLHGLAMAKTYLEVSPNVQLLIIDQAQSVGGTWASERLYPGLKTNNLVGSYEFSDFPMVPERYGLQTGDHIPGAVVHQYFCDFAEHFGLYSRLLLRTRVDSAISLDNGSWSISLTTESESDQACPTMRSIVADKLVLATGLTSDPYIPTFKGQRDFQGPILHAKELRARAGELAELKNVLVVGGNKSAWDMCYNAAKAGAHVDMVIRPGGGPSYVWPSSFKLFGFRTSLARLSSTRLFTCFDPSLHGDAGPFSLFRRFLHRTTIGQAVLSRFWRLLDVSIKRVNQYDSHPQLAKLTPWITPFWMGNSLSIHNYDSSWFQLVRDGRVHVHIAEVTSLSEAKVHLSNDVALDADAIICCTGWKTTPSVTFDETDGAEFSNLHPLESPSTQEIETAAAESIYNQRPYLRTLPKRECNAPRETDHDYPMPEEHLAGRYELYRFLVPCERRFIEQRNIAFIGAHSCIHAAMVAQVQALWITAFFHGRLNYLNLPRIDFQHIKDDSILHSMYGEIRRPKITGGAGRKYPDLVFDSLPYIDALLQDLGLKTRRKSSLLREIFESYCLKDYQGLVEDWNACT